MLGYESVGFSGAFVEYYRNNHNYMADMQAERPLYEQAGALVEFFQKRSSCCSARMFRKFCLSLLDDLYPREFIEAGDVATGYEWIQVTGASFDWINASSKAAADQSQISPL